MRSYILAMVAIFGFTTVGFAAAPQAECKDGKCPVAAEKANKCPVLGHIWNCPQCKAHVKSVLQKIREHRQHAVKRHHGKKRCPALHGHGHHKHWLHHRWHRHHDHGKKHLRKHDGKVHHHGHHKVKK